MNQKAQTDKEFFETDPTLQSIINKESISKELLYNEIISKPLMTGWDIINLPLETNDYLIENFLWKGSVVFVVGREKACKSIFTSQKAMALTVGGSFLESFEVPHPLNVLYIQAESDLLDTKTRYLSATQAGGVKWNPDKWRHFYPSALCLDLDLDSQNIPIEGGYTDLVNRIVDSEFNPEVIIIDPLYMAMEGDLSDNRAARKFCRNIRRLKERFRCAIIIDHHEHRAKLDIKNRSIEEGDNSIFGSSMWKNFASHVLRISIVNSQGNPVANEYEEDRIIKYRKVACATQRNGEVVKKIMLKLIENPLMLEIVDKSNSNMDNSIYELIKFNKEMCVETILESGIFKSAGSVRNALYRLRNSGTIVKGKKEGRNVYWKINELL